MLSLPKNRRARSRQGAWTLYLAFVGIRLLLILRPPAELTYNPDELQLTLSSCDRLLGVPFTALTWPGSFLNFWFLPLLGVDFLVSGHDLTLDGLALYLAAAYEHPAHVLLLMRLVSWALASALPLVVYALARHLSGDSATGILAAGTVSLTPMFFQHSVMATGDAASISLALGALAVVVLPERRTWRGWGAGLLLGAAAASKLTILNVAFAAGIFILAHEKTPRGRLKQALGLTGGFLAGLLVWYPYLWTDPLRTAKSVVGNVNKMNSYADLAGFFSRWGDAVGPLLLALGIISPLLFIMAMRAPGQRPAVLGLIAAMILVAIPLWLRTSTTYPRYYLAFAPLAVLLLAAASSSSESAKIRQGALAATKVFLLVTSIWGAVRIARDEWALRQNTGLETAVQLAETIPGDTPLFVPVQATLLGFDVPHATYHRILQRLTREQANREGLVHYLKLRGITPLSSIGFQSVFDDDDQAALARARLLSAATEAQPRSHQSVILWCDDESTDLIRIERSTICELDRREARARYLASPGAALLAPRADASLGTPWFEPGTHWVWYRNNLHHPAGLDPKRTGNHRPE